MRLLHLVARRGNSLRSAIALGVRFVEIEVQLANDGTPLVSPDQDLAKTLSLLEGRPEITVFVMIARASVLRFGQEQVVARIARTLRPFRSRCIVGSADLPTVHAARALAGYPIAWELSSYDAHTRLKYEALQPEYIFCDRAHLPVHGQLWRGPWRWGISEVETLESALALAERGADFVITRHVRSLSEAMLSHSAATTHSKLEWLKRS